MLRLLNAEHPNIPLVTPDLGEAEADAVARCVRDGWVSSAGPDVPAFEAELAAIVGRRFAVATSAGTTALHLALRAHGVGPGDRVAVSDWTFAASANAILMAGAEPVFVDVEADSWAMDPHALRAAIDAVDLRAVMVVHACGHPADIDALRAAAPGLTMIEDAAGALGATYRDRPAGALCDGAAFSFNGNKVVTAGGGGAFVTDDPACADAARRLSAQARDGARYRYTEAGFNYRMPNLNAALGRAQLARLDGFLAAKRAVAARYDAAFHGRNDMQPMPRLPWASSSCWLYSVRLADAASADSLVAHLKASGVEARNFWEALSDQPPYADYQAFGGGSGRALSGTVVSLPCSSHLAEDRQAAVIAAVAQWRGVAFHA